MLEFKVIPPKNEDDIILPDETQELINNSLGNSDELERIGSEIGAVLVTQITEYSRCYDTATKLGMRHIPEFSDRAAYIRGIQEQTNKLESDNNL